MLDEIKQRLLSNDLRPSDALSRALPKFRGLVPDSRLEWCANELNGYQNAFEYYQGRANEFPGYRVVIGKLKILRPDNTFAETQHKLAQRSEFFLAAPLQWIEDFYTLPGHTTVVDLPELTTYIGRTVGGTAVCECEKGQLELLLQGFNNTFLALLDETIEVQRRKAAAKGAAPNPFGGFQPPPQF